MRLFFRFLIGLVAVVAGVACGEPHPDHACAYYSGPGFDNVWVCYEIDGDLAVLGDMILGTHEELQHQGATPRNAVGGRKYYWPKARVPYTIAADVPMDLKQRIADAIGEFHASTPLHFVPKTDKDKDYVEFVMAAAGVDFGGRSYLGRKGGGRQIIELNPNLRGLGATARGTIIHEMGHAVGLTHEQCRPDRDEWIRVDLNLIKESWRPQYQIHGQNVLTYDYSSIMHYRLDLDLDGRNEMTPLKPGAPANIGRGTSLSQQDIYDLGFLYSDWEVYWQSLGNTSLADIQVATNADGRLEVFGLRNDGELFHIWQVKPRSGWSGWESFGGGNQLIAVGRNWDGRLELFSVAGDQVWHRWQTRANGTWSDWTTLGSALSGIKQMAVGKNRDGRLELFARRQSGELVHIWQDRRGVGGWSDWSQLADVGATDLSVKENRDGRIEVAWVAGGTPQHMWQRINFSGISWDGPANFDHAPTGAVTDVELARNNDGHLEIFATLAAGGMQHSWQDGGWSQWVAFSPDGGPNVAEYDGDGHLEVFKLVGGHVYHRWQTRNSGGDWSDWEKMPGSPGDVTKIVVARNEARNVFQSAYLELFAIRRDGGGVLFHTWRTGRELGLPDGGGGGGGNQTCSGLQDDPCVGSSDDGMLGESSGTTGDQPTSTGTTGEDPSTSDGSTTRTSLSDGTTGDDPSTTGDDPSTSGGTTGDTSYTGSGSYTSDGSTTSGDVSYTGDPSYTSGVSYTSDGTTTTGDSYTTSGPTTTGWTGGTDTGTTGDDSAGSTTWSPDLGVNVDVAHVQ
jgi:hypothetical protein